MKTAGLVNGGSLIAKGSMAKSLNEDEIRKLNPEQNEFMERYGLWMDEFRKLYGYRKKTHSMRNIGLEWRHLHKDLMILNLS